MGEFDIHDRDHKAQEARRALDEMAKSRRAGLFRRFHRNHYGRDHCCSLTCGSGESSSTIFFLEATTT